MDAGTAAAGQQRVTRAELLALLREHGGAPRSYFATMPRLHYLRVGECIVPYRRGRQVAILLDSPLGPVAQRAVALQAFCHQMRRDGLQPACYKLVRELAPAAADAGLSGVKFGDEALIDLPQLSFRGRRFSDIRDALRNVPQAGYSAQWYDLAADPRGWREALRAISERWLARKFGGEIGFAISRMAQAEKYAAEQRTLVLADAADTPRAFITLVPVYGHGGGWALDLMRRDGDAPADGMRYLIARAMLELKSEGCALLSLGLAPLADKSPDEWPGERLDRVRDILFARFNQLYNFRGLARFKSRFGPRWEPRYLAFPPNALPLVLLSLYRAHWT